MIVAEAKSLPSAPECESEVLASCLTVGNVWWSAVERAGGDDVPALFWDPNYRLVAEAMMEIRATGGNLSIPSMIDHLAPKPSAEALVPDLRTYLVQLKARASLHNLAGLDATLNTLIRHRTTRNVIRDTELLLSTAREGVSDPNEIAAELRQISLSGGVSKRVPRFGEVIAELEKANAMGVPWRIPTGVKALDGPLRGGYEPGRLYLYGARPKVGKTTILLASCVEALQHRPEQPLQTVVVFASLEIGARELYSKLLSAVSIVPQRELQKLLDKLLKEEDFSVDDLERIEDAKRQLNGARLHALFSADLHQGVDSLISAVMGIKAEYPEGTPIVVFLDYVQLLASGESFNKSAEIGIISRKLKLFADEMQLAIVTASQINRAGAGVEEGMPAPHHLRESGNLEQDADLVILLNRPHLQDETEPEHIMDMHVALNRVGPPAWLKAHYEPAYQTIRDLNDDEDEDFDEERPSRRRRSRAEVTEETTGSSVPQSRSGSEEDVEEYA